MKIMFINPTLPVFLRIPSLPLGLISIASYLKNNGHEVKIIEPLVSNIDIDVSINEYKPDIIGISVMSFLAGIDAKRITSIAHKYGIPVVWGGQAPSAMPEVVLNDTQADYIMLGEGEITWQELVDALEAGRSISEVKGLAYKENNKIVYTGIRPVADISQFPDIDWSMIDVTKYFSSFFNCNKMLYLHASKGCPAQCTFCSNQVFHQSKNRCRNIEQILRDIDYLYSKGTNGIYFSDELWIPERKRRTEFCSGMIKRNYNLVWGCQMRLGVLNEEDIDLMYKAGCRWILFGIESGNESRIKSIKKNIDLSLAENTVKMCESKGITVQASFIVGFPDETAEEIRNTIRFAEGLNASLTVMNILIPLPNSEIYEYANKNGLFSFPETIEKLAYEVEQNVTDNVLVNLSSVPDRDLKVIHYFYQWKAFAGKGSVNNDSYGIIKKAASDAIDRIFKHGLKGFVYGTYSSVMQFSRVFIYSHVFRKTLKKYNLK